jgi:hypothetical protein
VTGCELSTALQQYIINIGFPFSPRVITREETNIYITAVLYTFIGDISEPLSDIPSIKTS